MTILFRIFFVTKMTETQLTPLLTRLTGIRVEITSGRGSYRGILSRVRIADGWLRLDDASSLNFISLESIQGIKILGQKKISRHDLIGAEEDPGYYPIAPFTGILSHLIKEIIEVQAEGKIFIGTLIKFDQNNGLLYLQDVDGLNIVKQTEIKIIILAKSLRGNKK